MCNYNGNYGDYSSYDSGAVNYRLEYGVKSLKSAEKLPSNYRYILCTFLAEAFFLFKRAHTRFGGEYTIYSVLMTREAYQCSCKGCV
jgi:hypothetical protein